MLARLSASLLLLACAACSVPMAQPSAPNGDVVRRGPTAAPDTVTNAPPPRGYRDNSVDTDPSAPRTRDTQQRVQVPFVTQ